MTKQLLPDPVWETIEPYFPPRPPRLKGGRPATSDRDVLTGILFVLKTGIAWDDLPLEMGCGCGVTCLRRLREWDQSGTWQQVARILRSSLRHAKRIDWARAESEARDLAKRSRRVSTTAEYCDNCAFIKREESSAHATSSLPQQDQLTES